MRVVGLCGSLRKASCNAGLLRSFEEVLKAKHGIILEVVPIGGLPLFNEDLEASSGLASVKAFRESLAKADGMVFATCEYNASISAALKNAIDWGTRGVNLFNNKAAVVAGAGGFAGTTKAQSHLREILQGINCHAMTHPELRIEIFKSPRPFDGTTGDLVCERTKTRVEWTMAAYAQYLAMVRGAKLDAVGYRPA